jgi:hypothetical protein
MGPTTIRAVSDFDPQPRLSQYRSIISSNLSGLKARSCEERELTHSA